VEGMEEGRKAGGKGGWGLGMGLRGFDLTE